MRAFRRHNRKTAESAGEEARVTEESGVLEHSEESELNALETPPASSTIVEFRSASFTYGEEHVVFHDLDLQIYRGEFLNIIGGNGSGKSTLARCINGLLIPQEGSVWVNGYKTSAIENRFLIRKSVGMVFQNPDDQLVSDLIENEVAFGPENLGIPASELRELVLDALYDVGLEGFESRETHALSGGQKQRLAIAGALVMEPDILILDEATAMLDPQGSAEVRALCHQLHQEGMTVVIITQSMDEAAEAERVVVFDHGSIVLDGPPDEVLVQADLLADLALEAPFAVRLSNRLNQMGVTIAPTLSESSLVQSLIELHEGGHSPFFEASSSVPTGRFNEASPHILEFQDVGFAYNAEAVTQSDSRHTMTELSSKRNPEDAMTGAHNTDPWALRHVSFSVYEGEFLGVVGATGSGKSTLVQQMNGLLSPTEGQVIIGDRTLSDRRAAAWARQRVGMVFQYPEHQLFASTVADDVAFGPHMNNLPEKEVQQRVNQALQDVGLDPHVIGPQSPFSLSGGQQRRVALAGILAMKPSILVLDEPVAGLDPQGRQDLFALLRSLNQAGTTCVMISHSMDDLALLCDRILVLSHGRLIKLEPPETLFALPNDLKTLGLDIPRAQKIAHPLKQAGYELPRLLYDEATLAQDIALNLAKDQSNL